jgi:hypothetical protein
MTFSEGDLDQIVSSFNDAGLSGRVPIKYGHAEPDDSKPALGWVSRVWRAGKELFADIVDIPETVYSQIKRAAYKFVSIELLKGSSYNGKQYPYLLDAIALLGAAPPAVDGLGDLQSLTHKRQGDPATGTRLSFAWNDPEDDGGDDANEVTELRAKLAAAESARDAAQAERDSIKASSDAERLQFSAQRHRDDHLDTLEHAVRDFKITPAQRDQIVKLARLANPDEALKFSRAEVQSLIAIAGTSEVLERMGIGKSVAFSSTAALDARPAGSAVVDIALKMQAADKSIDLGVLLSRAMAAAPPGEAMAIMDATFE